MNYNKKIKFSALTKFQYKVSIFLIIMSIPSVVVFFMIIAIHYSLNNFLRGEVVSIFGILGIFTFFVLAFFIKKVFANEYELKFEELGIYIHSKNSNDFVSYEECKKFIIWNNTDYSKIIINTKSKEIRLYIGFAYLGRKPCQILSTNDELDNIFLNNNFTKQNNLLKNIEVIEYTKHSDFSKLQDIEHF